MSNFTFFGSNNKGDLTLADISNTINENAAAETRGNSPHFHNPNIKEIKEDPKVKKKISESPYLNSLGATFHGPARVRKSSSVQKMRPVSPSPIMETTLRTIPEKPLKSTFGTMPKLEIPLLPKDLPLTELNVSEIRKKMRSYQPVTERDRSTSWDRVLTEPVVSDVVSQMRTSQTAYKASKTLKLKKKGEDKTLLHQLKSETNKNLREAFDSLRQTKSAENDFHKRILNDLEELKPVKLVLEKIFDSVHYTKSEINQKHLYENIKKKISDECTKCPEKKKNSAPANPAKYNSTPVLRSARDRSREIVKHVIDDSFGSPNKRDKSADMKPPLHIPHKSTDPSGVRESLELLGSTKPKFHLPISKTKKKSQENLRIFLKQVTSEGKSEIVQPRKNTSASNDMRFRRAKSGVDSVIEESSQDINQKTTYDKIFVKLSRNTTIPNCFNLKFTSVYNSMEVVIKEKETSEIHFPKNFLTDPGSTSPQISMRYDRSRSITMDSERLRVQSARGHNSVSHYESKPQYTLEDDHSGLQESLSNIHSFVSIKDLKEDKFCQSCFTKLEGVKAALDEFVNADKKAVGLSIGINESIINCLKETGENKKLFEKNAIVNSLTSVTQASKGLFESANLLIPLHTQGFERLTKSLIYLFEITIKSYELKQKDLVRKVEEANKFLAERDNINRQMNQLKDSQTKLLNDFHRMERSFRETTEKKDARIAALTRKVDLLKLQGLDTQLEEYIETIKRKGMI